MKPKLLFWVDPYYTHYGLAKYMGENMNCQMYSIFEVTDNAKKFFSSQKIVNFEKVWFYHDHVFSQKSNPDIKYLEEIEKKYNLNLQLIAFHDRIFYHYNGYYKFSRDEILLIMENQIRFFDKILDSIKPDFIIMSPTTQQHNHIFYKICKSRGIKIIMAISARIGVNPNSSRKHSNRWYLSDEVDPCLPLPDEKNDDLNNVMIPEKDDLYTDEKFSHEFQKSTKKYTKAALNYLFTNDENVKTHYTYFGRTKFKVIFKMIHYELRKKYRENFMEKNLEHNITKSKKFVYFPLHQDQERILLIGAPFFRNQFESIKNIAFSLPVGFMLYVKDHTAMNARGWRSVNEMEKIMALPNVKLFHPIVNSKELIEKSELVVSTKGSSAIESGFYKKPSICFGKIGMYQISTMTNVKSIKDLPKIIKESLEKKVDENEIRRYEKMVYKNTFEFPLSNINDAFEDVFKIGGYYANVEIKSEKMLEFLKRYEKELTFLAMKHVEKINNYK